MTDLFELLPPDHEKPAALRGARYLRGGLGRLEGLDGGGLEPGLPLPGGGKHQRDVLGDVAKVRERDHHLVHEDVGGGFDMSLVVTGR